MSNPGLGLFISRKLCQLHGGDIGVASKYGVGSTFGFFFRVKRSKKPEGLGSDDESDNESLADSAAREVAARDRASSLQSDSMNQEFDQPQNIDVKPPRRVDNAKMPESLINPPTEFREEAHPGISTDERHNVTEKVAERVRSSDREDSPERDCGEKARKSAPEGDRNEKEDLKQEANPPPKSGESTIPTRPKAPSTLSSYGNGKNVL